MWNTTVDSPFVRGSRGEMIRASEADYGRRGLGSIALRGGTSFFGAKALLGTLGLGGGWGTAAAVALAVDDVMPDCIDWLRRTQRSSRTIPQCSLVDGSPEEHSPLYEKRISRQSRQPYDFEYSKPGYTFTGIACLPVSAEIQSPEAAVISGGINCSSVTIRLTPVEEGEWACRVLVCGKLFKTRRSAEVSQQTGRAVASDLRRRSRRIPQRRLVEGTAEERDALHDKIISRRSPDPFDYKYSKPGYTFTGIACLPVSAEIQSPDAAVISGGINCSSVTIRLTPLEEGEWECRVVVYGRLCTTGPSAEVSKQVAPTHATVAPTPTVPAASTAATLAGIPVVWLVALVAFLVVMFLMFIMIVIMMIVIMRA